MAVVYVVRPHAVLYTPQGSLISLIIAGLCDFRSGMFLTTEQVYRPVVLLKTTRVNKFCTALKAGLHRIL